MAVIESPVGCLVVDWRYDPSLAVYSAMDRLGLEFREQFADWQRTPLTLELRDKKQVRRFVMAHNRTFYHVISPLDGASSEIDKALQLFNRLAELIEVRHVRRVALRQWFSFKVQEPFRELTRISQKKFLAQAPQEVLQGTIDDMSYVVDVIHGEGWGYSLRAAPMLKEQWFQVVPYQEEAFESSHAFDSHKDVFPEAIFYVDIDAHKDDVPLSDMNLLLRSMRTSTDKIASDLNAFRKAK